ncbi:hypothetical protein SH528x_000456 [Novipirellula sp. SH528]|uniref:hypothetical protein n=1 Tax=Novipirellula sp. SH528 TaxID=3454466 RepID=UPI003FA03A0E
MSEGESHWEGSLSYGAFDFPQKLPSFAKITAKPQNPLAPEKIRLQPINTIPHAKAASEIKAASEKIKTKTPLATVAVRVGDNRGIMYTLWIEKLRQHAAAHPQPDDIRVRWIDAGAQKRTSHNTRLSIVL